MKSFTTHHGLVVPLDKSNVDTDQIIPKQYLKSVTSTGYGEVLFDSWRYLDPGHLGVDHSKRRLNPGFVLNEPCYQKGSVLLTRDNFGCGSSREHAVWALLQAGYCVVLAPSFSDIFRGNCYNNGMLPVALEASEIDTLFQRTVTKKGYCLHISLPEQMVSDGESQWHFEIDAFPKRCLLEGLDQIALTLEQAEKIRAYEREHARTSPWIFSGDPAS